MDLGNIILAFMGGLAGAGFGGVQMFVICAGMCLMSVTSGSAGVSAVAFSAAFTPATTFIGAACAMGYANYKGYGGGNNNAASSMMLLKKVDVLLVGGITGALGWVLNWALGQLGIPGFDTVAGAVIILPLICKVIFDKKFLGTISEEDKAVGGRFSPLGGRGWYGGMRRGIDKVIWPAAYGSVIACGMILFAANVNPATAGLLGFGFGGFVLMFPTVPAQHFIGCTVCTALGFVSAASGLAVGDLPLLTGIFWGLGGGALAANMADLGGDLFSRFSKTHIDVPAFSIMVSTLILGLLQLAAPALYGYNWLPLVFWVIFLAYGLFYDSKWKKVAAQKGVAI